MSIEFENDSVDVGVQKIEYYIDKDSSLKFLAPYIASSNFNGTIPIVDTMLTASFLKPGMTIAFNGGGVGDQYFPIVSIEFDDLDLTDSPTNLITIKYLDADSIVTSKEIDKSESVAVRYEDWDDKDLGSLGWSITSGGNAIFTNVGVRGEIEATTLDVGGVDGITYDGNTVTIGASVIINAPLTVGASGNFIVSGSAAQDIISNNTTITGGNIATGRIKSTGYSGPGTGSAFSTAGMSINLDDGSIAAPNFKIDSDGNAHFKGTVQSASGNLAGFILSASQISIAGFTMSTASGIYLGSNQEFKVDIQGNLVATSASISGDIRAKSGTFSGSVTAAQIYGASVTGGIITGQQIVGGTIIGASGTFTGNLTATNLTASAGNIGGFNITKDSLNANNFAISTSGGLALGSASQFYVDTSGNLIANSASLTGNITANSGRFLGSVGVNGAGSIYAGNDPNTGQRIILTSSGLFGFDSGNINIFSLPITGSPTIAGFTVVNTGLTGSGQMANMIFGNRGDSAYNITVRGDKTGGQAAAIYTTVNGVATTSNANNGFYLDDTGKMRLAGSNGSLTFDGSNLSVTGNINATTGTFAGSLSGATGTFAGSLSSGVSITSPVISGGNITGTNIFTSLLTIDAPTTANPASIIGGEIALSGGLVSNISLNYQSGYSTFSWYGKNWAIDSSISGINTTSLLRDQLYLNTSDYPERSFILRSGYLKNVSSGITQTGASLELKTKGTDTGGTSFAQILANTISFSGHTADGTRLSSNGVLVVSEAGTADLGVYQSGTIKGKFIVGNGSGLTNLTGANISGNIPGNANNITQYSINQNVGTGNNVSFNQVSAPIFLGQNNVELRQTVISTSAPTNPSSYRAGTLWAVV